MVCRVELTSSPRPRFVIGKDNQEVFYLRTGNASKPLKLSEFTAYLATAGLASHEQGTGGNIKRT